jgi:hypothetical protein
LRTKSKAGKNESNAISIDENALDPFLWDLLVVVQSISCWGDLRSS